MLAGLENLCTFVIALSDYPLWVVIVRNLKVFQPSLKCLFSIEIEPQGYFYTSRKPSTDYKSDKYAKREGLSLEREPVPWVQGSQTCQGEGVQARSQRQGRESPLPLPERWGTFGSTERTAPIRCCWLYLWLREDSGPPFFWPVFRLHPVHRTVVKQLVLLPGALGRTRQDTSVRYW